MLAWKTPAWLVQVDESMRAAAHVRMSAHLTQLAEQELADERGANPLETAVAVVVLSELFERSTGVRAELPRALVDALAELESAPTSRAMAGVSLRDAAVARW